MQNLTDDAKAILLLCGRFSDSDAIGVVKPLTLGEYNSLADWMMRQRMRPADLLTGAVRDRKGITGVGIDLERLRKLLSRGAAMALAVEKWVHNGVWIVCRSDDAYPGRLKRHLKRNQAPPILFGIGNIHLLSEGGLAVVGSRNVGTSGEAFTRKVGAVCARQGMAIVSGGARGVDQIAMLSALNAGGNVIGVLADGLFKAALSGKYRKGIMEETLVLVSPYHPDARFMVGNAMGRNKLIYALADFSLVISAEKDKGGTWAGAKEELKRAEPKPVFVRMEGDIPAGNQALIACGACPFPESPWREDLRRMLEKSSLSGEVNVYRQESLFGPRQKDAFPDVGVKEESSVFDDGSVDKRVSNIDQRFVETKIPESVYEAILPLMLSALDDWKTPKDLTEELGVRKMQINDWINRAIEQGVVEKKIRPVRYRRK